MYILLHLHYTPRLNSVWLCEKSRVDPRAAATRVALDDDYMLLLWKHDDEPKRICDIFFLKHRHRYVRNISIHQRKR